MKKIIAPYIILCVLFTSVSNFSFAADTVPSPSEIAFDLEKAYCETQSSVCGTAPKDFTALLDFVREMSNSIKTIGPEWPYLGKYVNPNRFKWNIFTAPQHSIVGRVARNVSQKIKFGFATTAIFSSPVNFAGLKDMLWWVVLLSKNHVFLRDNKLVEQMESQVNDKKYELGLWGWWYEQVNLENRVIMQGIIKKYIDIWLLTAWSVKDGVSYNNITSLLTQTLSAAKGFLYFGSTDQFNTISRGAADQGISIRFNDLAIATLQRNYTCARWPHYICSSESKKFKEGVSKLWKSFTFWSASTKKTFNDANDRLSELFAKDKSQDFKDRKAELLTSMYGTKKITPGKLIDIDYEETNGSATTLTDIWVWIGDAASAVSKVAVRSRNILTKDIREEKALQDNVVTTKYTGPDTVIQLIDIYIDDIFLNQQTDVEFVRMAEVQDVTPAFKVLWDQLSVIKNDILGGKDKDNSLIWSLGVACELQCGRWWLCR